MLNFLILCTDYQLISIYNGKIFHLKKMIYIYIYRFVDKTYLTFISIFCKNKNVFFLNYFTKHDSMKVILKNGY